MKLPRGFELANLRITSTLTNIRKKRKTPKCPRIRCFSKGSIYYASLMKMQMKRLARGCVAAILASSLLASPSAAKNPSAAPSVINGQLGHPWNGASVFLSLANQELTTVYLPLKELPTPKLALSKLGRYYGTKVLKSNVDEQGLMTASIRTRLRKGRPIWVTGSCV